MRKPFLIVVLVIAGFLVGRELAPPPEEAPVAGIDIDLVDHGGAPVDGTLFDARVSLVFFGYTHCPDICPATLARMRMVKDALGEDARNFQGVFITVDPVRDTPERLRSYVTHFDPGFIGLTGTDEALRQAAALLGAVYRRGDDVAGGYLMDHTAFGHVVAPNGTLARLFPHDAPVEEMTRSIRAVLADSE